MATTVLNLFPSRIKFVNDDGTLTPEASRALGMLMARVGGPVSVSITEISANLTAINNSIDALPFAPLSAPDTPDVILESIFQQPVPSDFIAPDVVQPQSSPVAYASGGPAPAGGVGTAAGGWDTAAHRDSAITLLNNIRTALINAGIMS